MGLYKLDFEQLTKDELNNENILQYLNEILFEVNIIEGVLICENCKKEYKIKGGIPNLVLEDNEV